MSIISDNLKKARKASSLTQEKAAAAIGIKRPTLASYEEERARPDIDLLPRICEVYNIQDWQSFLKDADWEPGKERTASSFPSLLARQFNQLDEKQKNLARMLLNLD